MTAELNAYKNLMGGVRKATKGQKLRMSKKTQRKLDYAFGKKEEDKEKTTTSVKESRKQERPVANKAKSAPKAQKQTKSSKAPNAPKGKPEKAQEPMFVPSTRMGPPSPKGVAGPSSGPGSIGAPGPAPRELAAAKAAAAKKGTKNRSTIKVATPFVDLESSSGGVVHEITDVPRQWKKKNA